MATKFRFAEPDATKPVTIMQRSHSAPEENNTFLAAVMAAGGNMSRSMSASEFSKASSHGGPGHGKGGVSHGSGIAIPNEVDTSLNEDLFYPSVSAAAAITLSPSFGPNPGADSKELFYPNYLAQGGSTWSLPQKKHGDEMPSLGLPEPAGQPTAHSPRSNEYTLRLSPSSGSSTASAHASDHENMYQIRAAMAGMQLGSTRSNGGSRNGANNGNNVSGGGYNPAASQYEPPSMMMGEATGQSSNNMYDVMSNQIYYQDGYGTMYPANQYVTPYNNRYGGDPYPPTNSRNGGNGGGAPMMDQRYAYNNMYGSNGYPLQMQQPEYAPSPPQRHQPQQQRGVGMLPRNNNSNSLNVMAQPYPGIERKQGNPMGGGRKSQPSQLAPSNQQQMWTQGYEEPMYHDQQMNARPSSRNGGGSILEDVRQAMRNSGSGSNQQPVMNRTPSRMSNGSGGYPRGNNGHPAASVAFMTAPQQMIHHHHSQQQQHHHVSSSVPSSAGQVHVPYTLSDVRGHAVEFAQDQFGSRWLQQQLSSTHVSAEDKQALFLELLPAARELAGDTFGNYCVQILLNPQVGTPEQQLALCTTAFEGHMLALSRNTYACRCIQSLVKLFQMGDAVIPIALQDKMLHELDQDIFGLVTDSNANHVAQQIIERVRPMERIRFVLDSFKGRYIVLAKDPYGCRVCQRVLEYATPEYVEPALDELLSDIDDLVTDSMGNYVVQHIITASGDRYGPQKARLVEAIKKKLLMFATHKFASNVVEKVLEHGDTPTRRELIHLMLDGQATLVPGAPTVPMLQVMMSDLFANYVCQRSLAVAERDQLIRLVAIVRASAHELRRMTYGKHILSACEKAAAAAGIP